jgi:uncharacterized membrane protein YagU involved in acid resistance
MQGEVSSDESKKIETSAYWTWLGEDGIARTQVKKGSEVELDHAVENSRAVNSLNAPNFPLLIDARGIKSMTKEAREYFSVNDRETKVTAMAILIKSPLSKVIGNFYMLLNKPKMHSKLFIDEASALKWLKKFQ